MEERSYQQYPSLMTYFEAPAVYSQAQKLNWSCKYVNHHRDKPCMGDTHSIPSNIQQKMYTRVVSLPTCGSHTYCIISTKSSWLVTCDRHKEMGSCNQAHD